MDKLINYNHLEFSLKKLKTYIDALYSMCVKIDGGLEIGGTNLLLNTDFRKEDQNWTIAENTAINILESDNDDIVFKHIADRCVRIEMTESSGFLIQEVELLKEEKYTASCWIYSERREARVAAYYVDADDDNSLVFLSHTEVGDSVGKWTRVYTTFAANDLYSTHKICFGMDGDSIASGGVCYVCLPQLEKGTVVTDWSPSPKDVKQYIDDSKTDMLATIGEDYVTKAEYQDFVAQTNSSFSEVNDSIETRYNLTASNINSVNNYLNQFKEQMESTIIFSELKTGLRKESYEFSVNEDSISFVENNQEIAKIQNSKMNMSDAAVSNSLLINNFKFVPGATGNLSLVWDDQNGGDN